MKNKKIIILFVLAAFLINFTYVSIVFYKENFLIFNSNLGEDVVYDDKIRSFIISDEQYYNIAPFFFPVRTHEDDFYMSGFINEMNYILFSKFRKDENYHLILESIKNNNLKNKYTQINVDQVEKELICSIFNYTSKNYPNLSSLLGKDLDSFFILRKTGNEKECNIVFYDTKYEKFIVSEIYFAKIKYYVIFKILNKKIKIYYINESFL